MDDKKEINQDTDVSEKRKLGSQSKQVIYLIIITVLVAGIASILNPAFLTVRNFLNIMQQISVLGILTMCMAIVMISGGLDISIGNMAGLVGMIFTLMVIKGYNVTFTVIVVLLISTLLGFINGFIISKSKVTPLILTLGMNYVFLGIALMLSGGRPQVLSGFEFLGGGKIAQAPFPTIVYFLIFIFMLLLKKYTKYGRRLNAIGGNPQAAYLSGINVDLHIISIYTLSGLIVGFAGLVLTSRLGMVRAASGSDYALKALAAAIIGGITFEGGRGSLLGAFVGVFLLGITYNSMNIIGISSYLQTTVLGAIIVVATVISNIGKMKRE